MEKKLIEICLNLTDTKKIKSDEFNTSGLLILESFLIEEDNYDNFIEKNLPIITNSIFNDFKGLHKELNVSEKIKPSDIIIRVTDSIKNIDFNFLT